MTIDQAARKERPILFSAPMVRAILDGRKTMTRRVVKQQPPADVTSAGTYSAPGRDYDGAWEWLTGDPRYADTWGVPDLPSFRCPFGRPGDRLWVREAACLYHDIMTNLCEIEYRAGGGEIEKRPPRGWKPSKRDGVNWRPSIHMPRWASRIDLEVTAVRVERLQDIRCGGDHAAYCAQVEAEGAILPDEPWCTSAFDGKTYGDHHEVWHSGWNALNAKRGFGWDANPWVWVVEFKRIRP